MHISEITTWDVLSICENFILIFKFVSFVVSISFAKLQVALCGHATLATAYFLFTSDLAEHDTIEFVSKLGLLVARKIIKPNPILKEENFTVELDFPADPVLGCDSSEYPSIPLTLNGVPIVNVMKTSACSDLIVIISDSLLFFSSVMVSHSFFFLAGVVVGDYVIELYG